MLELEEVKVHANDEAAQKAVLREELRRKETVSTHIIIMASSARLVHLGYILC